jgi:hypothetical protein
MGIVLFKIKGKPNKPLHDILLGDYLQVQGETFTGERLVLPKELATFAPLSASTPLRATQTKPKSLSEEVACPRFMNPLQKNTGEKLTYP